MESLEALEHLRLSRLATSSRASMLSSSLILCKRASFCSLRPVSSSKIFCWRCCNVFLFTAYVYIDVLTPILPFKKRFVTHMFKLVWHSSCRPFVFAESVVVLPYWCAGCWQAATAFSSLDASALELPSLFLDLLGPQLLYLLYQQSLGRRHASHSVYMTCSMC